LEKVRDIHVVGETPEVTDAIRADLVDVLETIAPESQYRLVVQCRCGKGKFYFDELVSGWRDCWCMSEECMKPSKEGLSSAWISYFDGGGIVPFDTNKIFVDLSSKFTADVVEPRACECQSATQPKTPHVARAAEDSLLLFSRSNANKSAVSFDNTPPLLAENPLLLLALTPCSS
jgi:hypothetical protein